MSALTNSRIARALQDLRPEAFGSEGHLHSTLQERMTYYATPGANVAVIDEFDLQWAQGFGVLTEGSDRKVTPTTLFQAASVSKVVFALAIMRLVEQGDLDLDTDVNDYLTSWKVPANRGWAPRITLRQLLSHTAGTNVLGFPGYPHSGPHPNLSQILQGIPPANNPPIVVEWLPGLQSQYSGGGITIAQQVLNDVTGQAFPELMRQLVFEPLAMSSSSFEQPLPNEWATQAATGHPWNRVPIRGGWHVYPELAAAGLWTTATDLARLGAHFTRAFRGKPSNLGISKDTAARMLRPQLRWHRPGDDFIGLAWFCSGQGNNLRCRHGGSNNGFVAQISLWPAVGRGAVVLLNSNQGAPLLSEIISAIAREFDWLPTRAIASDPVVHGNSNYAGLYCGDGGARANVERVGDQLTLQFDGQEPVPLECVSERSFVTSVLKLKVTFDPITDASPGHMSLTQGGTTLRFVLTRNDAADYQRNR